MNRFLGIMFTLYAQLPGVALAAHDDCRSLDSAYPEDVAKFKQDHSLCYHFTSEPPYDEERRQLLAVKIQEACGGLKKLCRDLQTKYSHHSSILNVLEVD